MAVLTDSMLIRALRSGQKKVIVPKGTIITPWAKDRIRAEGVELVEEDTVPDKQKPEAMTLLGGERYVPKNHPRIVFRGAIDSFIAELLLIMSDAHRSGFVNAQYLSHLIEIKQFMRLVQAAEAAAKPLVELRLLGLDETALREQSHHPKQYFGVDHLFDLDYTQDIRAIRINFLRTKARELEIKGLDALGDEDDPVRHSLLTALNRLSSALYIMEIWAVSGLYGE